MKARLRQLVTGAAGFIGSFVAQRLLQRGTPSWDSTTSMTTTIPAEGSASRAAAPFRIFTFVRLDFGDRARSSARSRDQPLEGLSISRRRRACATR